MSREREDRPRILSPSPSVPPDAIMGRRTFVRTASGLLIAATGLEAACNSAVSASSVPDPTKCLVAVSSPSIAVGETCVIGLQARDSAGANLTVGGARVGFTANGGTSVGTVGSVTDNGDGTYIANYTGVTAGTAQTINATVNGEAVTTPMPTVAVTAAAVPDPTQCTVTASPASIAVGGTATLTLQAKDSSGANLTGGGATVVFTASGGTATGTISATTDLGDGTYTAVYTGTGAGTAQTIGATINGTAVTTTLPTVTVTSTLAPPDILNNADFETGWDGLTNWSGGTPTVVDRSTAQAFTGSYSVHRNIPVTSGTDIGTQFIYTPSPSQDHVFFRTYFYLSAAMNGIMKFARWEGPSTGLGGFFIANGNLAWDFDVEASAQFTNLASLAGLVNGWHWCEADYWRNGDPSGFPSVAIWIDGTQLTSSLSQPNPTFWNNGRLYAGERGSTDQLQWLEWIATLNGTPNNTVVADIWVDRLAISSQRIGP